MSNWYSIEIKRQERAAFEAKLLLYASKAAMFNSCKFKISHEQTDRGSHVYYFPSVVSNLALALGATLSEKVPGNVETVFEVA